MNIRSRNFHFQALGKAASNGYTEIVELLIAHGGSLGIGLLGSSFGGYTDIVKSLVLKNAKVDCQTTVCDFIFQIGSFHLSCVKVA